MFYKCSERGGDGIENLRVSYLSCVMAFDSYKEKYYPTTHIEKLSTQLAIEDVMIMRTSKVCHVLPRDFRPFRSFLPSHAKN